MWICPRISDIPVILITDASVSPRIWMHSKQKLQPQPVGIERVAAGEVATTRPSLPRKVASLEHSPLVNGYEKRWNITTSSGFYQLSHVTSSICGWEVLGSSKSLLIKFRNMKTQSSKPFPPNHTSKIHPTVDRRNPWENPNLPRSQTRLSHPTNCLGLVAPNFCKAIHESCHYFPSGYVKIAIGNDNLQ